MKIRTFLFACAAVVVAACGQTAEGKIPSVRSVRHRHSRRQLELCGDRAYHRDLDLP